MFLHSLHALALNTLDGSFLSSPTYLTYFERRRALALDLCFRNLPVQNSEYPDRLRSPAPRGIASDDGHMQRDPAPSSARPAALRNQQMGFLRNKGGDITRRVRYCIRVSAPRLSMSPVRASLLLWLAVGG